MGVLARALRIVGLHYELGTGELRVCGAAGVFESAVIWSGAGSVCSAFCGGAAAPGMARRRSELRRRAVGLCRTAEPVACVSFAVRC